MKKSEIISLLTIRLYPESETPAPHPGWGRHAEKILCKICQKAYTLDYERPSAGDAPEILGGMLESAQAAVYTAHFTKPSHQEGSLEIAITFHR
jgi:hypothetical protein